MAEFIIQLQQQTEWCWAAVAVSVDHYFNPNSTLRQCDVANRVGNILAKGQDCCKDPAAFDQPQDLATAIKAVYSLRRSVGRALTFSEFRGEIDAGRPVCAGIKWKSGGAHAVVLTGYQVLSSGARHVHVEDPLNPSGDVDFDEFSDAYHGEGKWEATELLIPPRGGR